MVQLTTGQRVFVVKKYYETRSFIEVQVAFMEILQQRIRDEFENLRRAVRRATVCIERGGRHVKGNP